jgi:hypothetical protein
MQHAPEADPLRIFMIAGITSALHERAFVLAKLKTRPSGALLVGHVHEFLLYTDKHFLQPDSRIGDSPPPNPLKSDLHVVTPIA